MPLGSQQLVLDAAEFLKGMSSGPEISDGGFSTQTEALNLIAEPGVLYAPAQAANIDTDPVLTDEIIASSPDHAITSVFNRLLVAENGTKFSYNGTKVATVATGTDATNTYAKGFTDMINYAGETYITTKQTIVRWSGTATFNNAFFTFTTNNVWHPAIVFEDNAFYGDKNLLLRQTSAGGTPATILTLSTDQFIVALGIDPGTGKMLISTISTLNVSNSLPLTSKLLWYDGFSNKPLKSIIIEEPIYGFHILEGIVFVGYGGNIGYLSGSGITFLRKLRNVTANEEDLPYKHNFASIVNTLYVVDGSQILAFGEVIRGGKIFYYCYKNYITASQSATKFKTIFPAGDAGDSTTKKLAISVATTKLYTLDVTSKATLDRFELRTNWIHFPRPVNIKSLHVEYNDSIASTGNFTFSYLDQSGTTSKNLSVRNTPITSVFEFDVIGFQEKLKALKLLIQNVTENDGLKKITIYYDFVE